MLDHGIILKNHTSLNQKVTIFDKSMGKIDCIYRQRNYKRFKRILSPGILISYSLNQKNNFFKIDDFEYVYAPNVDVYLNKNNGNESNINQINFLHYILELCYHFLPWHQPLDNIFKDLLNIYYLPENMDYNQYNLQVLIFLCSFFKKLSIYPEDKKDYNENLINLISQIKNSKVDLKCIDYIKTFKLKDEIKSWINRCILTHPYNGHFKTLKFIKLL